MLFDEYVNYPDKYEKAVTTFHIHSRIRRGFDHMWFIKRKGYSVYSVSYDRDDDQGREYDPIRRDGDISFIMVK